MTGDIPGETTSEPPDDEFEDELAKGLPGLPLTVGRVRADESGLHYEGRDHSWDRVSSLSVRDEKLLVEGRRLYRPAVLLFEASVVPEDARGVELAWREYLLRRIERDGALKGTAAPLRLERRARGFFLAASLVILFGFVALSAALTESGAANPFERDIAGSIDAFALPVALAVVAAFLLASCLSAERKKRTLAERWKQWELRPEGLVVGRGERAVRGGEPVDFEDLTGQPLLFGLFLAMAERAGVAAGAGDVRGPAWKLARGFLLGGAVPALVSVAMGSAVTGGLVLTGAVLVIATLAFMSWMSYGRKRREMPRLLAEGREALERLGW